MTVLRPSSDEKLAEHLNEAAQAGQRITVIGNNSKQLAAGPVLDADVTITTLGLAGILAHERNDLTISVQAGMRLQAVQTYLQSHEQMIAMDPPFSRDCTVGGVLASDFSGPLRNRFGTARDQVIGMTFATLDGRLVQAGGMVVKNVAGLDLSKLLIGSFGTLAVMTSVNLRIYPKPRQIETFVFLYENVEAALASRDKVLTSVSKPWAIELFSVAAAARLGRQGYMLAVRVAGSSNVLERYRREFSGDELLTGAEDQAFWFLTANFTPNLLRTDPDLIVVRIGMPLSEVISVFQMDSGTYVSHAGSGTTDAYFSSWEEASSLWSLARRQRWQACVAFAPPSIRLSNELWLQPAGMTASNGFAIMKKVKQMFDSSNLLNRSRLYGYL